MRSVGMHGNKLILFIFSSNIPKNPQEMGTFFISDFLQIIGHPNVKSCISLASVIQPIKVLSVPVIVIVNTAYLGHVSRA